LADEFPGAFHLLGGEGASKKQKGEEEEFFHDRLGNWQ